MNSQKLNDIIEKNKPRMLETLSELIAVKSVAENKSGGIYPYGKPCAEALEIMLKAAENMGFATKNYEYHAGVADWDNSLGKPQLGVLCHLDVVPASPENWSSDPFKMVIRNGCIYGRGSIDNKGPAVAVLYAMNAIKEAGIVLKKNVRFLFGCDEENGSSDIEYYLTKDKMPPMVFTPDGSYPVIHIEKGMLRFRFTKKYNGCISSMNAGTVPNAVPAYAEAVLKDSSMECYAGIAAHASTPDLGDNAITGLLSVLAERQKCEDCEDAVALSKLFPHGYTGGEGLEITAEDNESGKLTCVLSMMSVENGVITCTADVRYPVCTSKQKLLEKIKQKLSECGFETEVLIASEPHKTPADSPFVQTLLSVYEEETGEKGECIAIGGGTYVHDIEGGVAFGAEMPDYQYNMHGHDEHYPIEHLMAATRMIAAAIVKICGEEK